MKKELRFLHMKQQKLNDNLYNIHLDEIVFFET